MTAIETLILKAKRIKARLQNKPRCYAAAPGKLLWIDRYFNSQATNPPKGFALLSTYPDDYKNVPTDNLARTFCALEDYELWLNRVDEGMKRHQDEMNRQAAHKIARLEIAQTFDEPQKP